MPIYKINDFPSVIFGADNPSQTREVRMLFSPELGNEDNLTMVTVVLRPGVTADEHIHTDTVEYMYFDKPGIALLDGVKYDVAAHSFFQAPIGHSHACGNEGTEDLNLVCFFVPAVKPYGKFFELIETSKEYLEKK